MPEDAGTAAGPRPHLIFQLAATFAAMGGVAGHARRGSWSWPGRSAIIGLLAAACGIRRDGDFARLDALRIAVAIFDAGSPMRDYHTAETVPSAAARRPQARPQALRDARGRTHTIVTRRDYRAGVLYGVAVQGDGLDALAHSLRQPVFQLYLGRKACTLAAPPDPQIVTAASAEDALAHLRLPPWASGRVADRLIADADTITDAQQQEIRYDQPVDRLRWHFLARDVASKAVHIAPGGQP